MMSKLTHHHSSSWACEARANVCEETCEESLWHCCHWEGGHQWEGGQKGVSPREWGVYCRGLSSYDTHQAHEWLSRVQSMGQRPIAGGEFLKTSELFFWMRILEDQRTLEEGERSWSHPTPWPEVTQCHEYQMWYHRIGNNSLLTACLFYFAVTAGHAQWAE